MIAEIIFVDIIAVSKYIDSSNTKSSFWCYTLLKASMNNKITVDVVLSLADLAAPLPGGLSAYT